MPPSSTLQVGCRGATIGEGSIVRLSFHLTSDSEVILDEQGMEVESLDHARREAWKTILKMRAQDPTAQDWSGWKSSVTDADGRVVVLRGFDGDPL